jgi:hypothetical protein
LQRFSAIRPHRALLLATAGLLVTRLVLVLARPGPIVVSDEIGYLTNARVLGGGVGAELLGTSFYEGGYSLLISPLVSVAGDPVAGYRLVLAANAVLAASVIPLLYLLLTRFLRVAPQRAVWPAVVAGCFPSLTPIAGTALSENALVPLSVAWLLCFGKLLDAAGSRSRAGWAAGTGLCAAALWAVHSRMLVVAVLTVLTLIALVVRRRLAAGPAAIGVLVLAGVLLGAQQLNELLIADNYGGRRFAEVASRLSKLDDPQRLVFGARNFAGQGWYLLASTFGVVLVLLAADWRAALRRVGRRDADTRDLLLALLLLAATGLLLASALVFGSARRPDRFVYGRYVEVLAPALVAVGLVALAGRRPSRAAWATVAILLGVTVAVAGLRAGLDARETPVTFNVSSLPFRPGVLGPWTLLAAGLVAAVGLCALLTVRSRSPAAVAPALLLLFLPTAALSERRLLLATRALYPSGWASPGVALEGRDVEAVAYDDDRADPRGALIYPWLLPETALVRFSSAEELPPSRYVMSSAAWPSDHPDRSAVALWEDPVRDQTLWRLRVDPLDAPRAAGACLRRAGFEVRRPAARSQAAQLVATPEAGGPLRVTFYATPRVATARAREAGRFVRVAGRRDAAVIARGGNAVAVLPAAVARSTAGAVRRCLARAS